jgi:hypothetical protein
MSGDCFQSMDITRVRRALTDLHERVATGAGRVEVTCRGREHICIIISKGELDALERALEILAGSDEYRAMSDTIIQVAAQCDGCTPAAQA